MTIMKYVEFLKNNDITPTKQRVVLEEIIFRENQHFTAADLIEVATKAGLEISQATIYNTLCLFEKKNILKTSVAARALGSSRRIWSLGALGEGSGWDLRVCPAASMNLKIWEYGI